MSPARVNIIAEGQTEDTFVRDILQVPLAMRAVFVNARLVEFGRRHHVIHRGGLFQYPKAKRDIVLWLAQDPTAYVTTMFDLYALPDDFPGRTDASRILNLYHKVTALEEALEADIDNPRFIPHLQLHEFEGLLFSDVRAIDEALGLMRGHSQLTALLAIRSAFKTPEEINDDEHTAPSKRISGLYPGYDKVVFGSLISERIGLDVIRRECPHFDAWLKRLEALGSAEGPER